MHHAQFKTNDVNNKKMCPWCCPSRYSRGWPCVVFLSWSSSLLLLLLPFDSRQVLEVEALIEVYTEKQKVYKKEMRTLKNWETGWLLLNSRPDDLETYLRLKGGMSDFQDRLAKVKTPEEHSELEQEYRKFKELQGRSERLLQAQKMLERVREDKDEALKVMLQASKELDAARHKEEELVSCPLLLVLSHAFPLWKGMYKIEQP